MNMTGQSIYFVQFRTRAEAQKRHEERQAKAQQKRELLQEEKAQKLKMLLKRVSKYVQTENANCSKITHCLGEMEG